MQGVTITGLQIENVKRVRAVRLDAGTLAPSGLTLIGGNNGQGKTSVLDAICGALGGDEFKQPVHEGAERGSVVVKLSNGITVERVYTPSGGSRLKVEDPAGKKGGQALLNEFVSPFALNVGEFMFASDKEKAKILLKVIGVNPQPYEEKIRALEADRLLKGRERDRAKGHAESLPFFEDAGVEKLDGNAISAQMTEALAFNARIRQATSDVNSARDRRDLAEIRMREAEKALEDARAKYEAANATFVDAVDKANSVGKPVDTQAVSAKLQEVTEHNERVNSNLSRKHAFEMAEALSGEYAAIQSEIEQVREELRATLEGASLPYPGLMVEDGELLYNGRKWGTLSESERLILATAVSRAVKPECRFVLIDGMERMDGRTRATFAAWLEAQGLQGIGTTVGNGSDCSLIIEDGVVAGTDEPELSFI